MTEFRILKTDRIILHVDMNNFYASCECREHPELRGKPVAVCGSVEERHGIVLAKNYLAKSCGVLTGEAIWQAKEKCRNLVIVPPHYDLYLKYSRLARKLYEEYTDQVEPFGLDECFLDVTHSTLLFGDGTEIADLIRNRVRDELGLTVSVGVSFCKVFAKLGSDLKKPDAVTCIGRDFQNTIWHLPAADLVGIGPATERVLKRYGIRTIGQLACAPTDFLSKHFGKRGLWLRMYANGEETSPVLPCNFRVPAKSVGHGSTTPQDLTDQRQVWCLMLELCRSIAKNLRTVGKKAGGITVTVRDKNLVITSWQCRLSVPTSTSNTLAREAYCLFLRSYGWENPIRTVTITARELTEKDTDTQLDFFNDITAQIRREKLDVCMDKIQDRYGTSAIQPATLLRFPDLSPGEFQPFEHFGLPMARSLS